MPAPVEKEYSYNTVNGERALWVTEKYPPPSRERIAALLAASGNNCVGTISGPLYVVRLATPDEVAEYEGENSAPPQPQVA
jgi:hypothetical protein